MTSSKEQARKSKFLIATSSHSNLIETTFRGDNRKLAEELMKIVEGMREYWPLTVRQLYYQAVSKMLVENNQGQYQRVSRVGAKLREIELVPWHAIEDRARRTIDKRGVQDLQTFAKDQMESFMNWRYYHRCYIQDQEAYAEVATEKDALSSIVEGAVWMYCTRVNIVRGQSSVTLVEKMAERYDKAIMRGKKPVLIYLGDLDPSGIAIPKSIIRRLDRVHDIQVELMRAALNPDQVRKYSLPGDPDSAKKTDPNYAKWLSEFGPDQSPVELDALHPLDLTEITQSALRNVYDVSKMSEQEENEHYEREQIKQIRFGVEDYLYSYQVAFKKVSSDIWRSLKFFVPPSPPAPGGASRSMWR